MHYKVHRLDINMENAQDKLAGILNSLKGEVVAINPDNLKRDSIEVAFEINGRNASPIKTNNTCYRQSSGYFVIFHQQFPG